jgi:hypothetical protein
VPGRKTDVNDATWLASTMRAKNDDEITVALAGIDTVTKHVTIGANWPTTIDFQLTLKG